MYCGPISPERIGGSVIAVPPLARRSDLTIHAAANAAMVRHIEAGGVHTLLYGGNANFYNVSLGEYDALLATLGDIAGEDAWVVPAVGPAYGTMIDQAAILRRHPFPTAMVLPPSFGFTPQGFARGFRRFVEAYGKPAVLYIKSQDLIDVHQIKALFDAGLVSMIKYAIVRAKPADDDYLKALVNAVDPLFVVSGMGEQPTLVHVRDFGLGGFTSGCVCVAPRLSAKTLKSLKSGDHDEVERILAIFRPLEELRNDIGPIRVLHDAVTLAEIADMGPILPLMSPLEGAERERVGAAARALAAQNHD